VEIQLVMHYCQLKDLCQFARCSKRLHTLAATPFATKHLPLKRLAVDTQVRDVSHQVYGVAG
jgi:hypothetical protein